MRKGDLVRVRRETDHAGMLPRADAVGRVDDEDGLRCWVQFDDPPLYAAGWPKRVFEKIGAVRGRALGEEPIR